MKLSDVKTFRDLCASFFILEFDPDSREVVWSYTDPMPAAFFSPYMGSVEKL